MTAPQTVADVLDAAADLLEKRRAWTQGKYYGDTRGNRVSTVSDASCFCVLGAIRAAGGYDRTGQYDANPAANALMANLATLHDMSGGLNGWNDAPGRTQSEVVAALRAAATSARQGETK